MVDKLNGAGQSQQVSLLWSSQPNHPLNKASLSSLEIQANDDSCFEQLTLFYCAINHMVIIKFYKINGTWEKTFNNIVILQTMQIMQSLFYLSTVN